MINKNFDYYHLSNWPINFLYLFVGFLFFVIWSTQTKDLRWCAAKAKSLFDYQMWCQRCLKRCGIFIHILDGYSSVVIFLWFPSEIRFKSLSHFLRSSFFGAFFFDEWIQWMTSVNLVDSSSVKIMSFLRMNTIIMNVRYVDAERTGEIWKIHTKQAYGSIISLPFNSIWTIQ